MHAATASSQDRALRSVVRSNRRPLTAMLTTIAVLHIAGVALLASTAGHGAGALGIGVGAAAYTLGMRHAFDADHIAAVDNTTRKFVGEGRPALSVGFWFSLGHSTVVFALTVALALGARALDGPLRDEGSTLHTVTGLIGTGVSGTFLLLIAAINIVLLAGSWRTLQDARTGRLAAAELDRRLAPRGIVLRLLGRFSTAIRSPWQMYPLGLLFGLGFDTATEVGLLVLAATSATAGVPWYALLSLPLLFAAGMSLLDTADGLFMNAAYRWAYDKPVRRAAYNVVVTGLSVLVAVGIGSVELLQLLGERVSRGGWLGGLDLNMAGYVVVGALAATWVVATLISRTRSRAVPEALARD